MPAFCSLAASSSAVFFDHFACFGAGDNCGIKSPSNVDIGPSVEWVSFLRRLLAVEVEGAGAGATRGV